VCIEETLVPKHGDCAIISTYWARMMRDEHMTAKMVYIVSAFETVEGREVMDSSRVLSWLQGGSNVIEREEPGCGKQERGMTRLTIYSRIFAPI
jgi:hypothetical protein